MTTRKKKMLFKLDFPFFFFFWFDIRNSLTSTDIKLMGHIFFFPSGFFIKKQGGES